MYTEKSYGSNSQALHQTRSHAARSSEADKLTPGFEQKLKQSTQDSAALKERLSKYAVLALFVACLGIAITYKMQAIMAERSGAAAPLSGFVFN